MDDIQYILATFWRVLETNPGRFLPLLASACVVTLIIAVVTDAVFRRQPARVKSSTEKRESSLQ